MRRKSGEKMAVKHYKGKLRWRVEALNNEFQLPEYFREMIGDKKEVCISDIGAGAISMIGSTWPGVKVKMVASDQLADDYNALWKERGFVPFIPIEKQDMEKLTYPDESFDIVHCVNALDHCEDPYKAIAELIRVCKKGGWIYLRHIQNEGENEKYAGFHQWNIEKHELGSRFWNHNSEFFLEVPTEIRTEIPNTKYKMEESIVSKWKKT